MASVFYNKILAFYNVVCYKATFDKSYYELIFSDGYSTDKIPEIIEERFAVIDCSRGGEVQCNFAAQAAKGNILFPLRADSYALYNRTHRLAAAKCDIDICGDRLYFQRHVNEIQSPHLYNFLKSVNVYKAKTI